MREGDVSHTHTSWWDTGRNPPICSSPGRQERTVQGEGTRASVTLHDVGDMRESVCRVSLA